MTPNANIVHNPAIGDLRVSMWACCVNAVQGALVLTGGICPTANKSFLSLRRFMRRPFVATTQ